MNLLIDKVKLDIKTGNELIKTLLKLTTHLYPSDFNK